MKKYILSAMVLLLSQVATAGLESPGNGETKSGIGLIRGWVCEANEVSISINGKEPKVIAYGNPRGDTSGACGDTDNGFETLWNWNSLGSGRHTITAFADGVAIGTNTFNVVTLGLTDNRGQEITYNRDLSASYALEGFPKTGKTTEVSWSEKDQNFMITELTDTSPANGLADMAPLDGVYTFLRGSIQFNDGSIIDSSAVDFNMSGSMTLAGNTINQSLTVTIDGQSATINMNGTYQDLSNGIRIFQSGFSPSDVILIQRGSKLVTFTNANALGLDFAEVDQWQKVEGANAIQAKSSTKSGYPLSGSSFGGLMGELLYTYRLTH